MASEIENADRNERDPAGVLFNGVRSHGMEPVEQILFTLRGTIHVPALERTWEALAQRHALLRANPRQTGAIRGDDLDQLKPEIMLLDWSSCNGADDPEARLQEFLARDRQRGIDTRNGLLFRVTLISQADKGCRVVLSIPNGLLHWRSFSTLLHEVVDTYGSIRKGGIGSDVAAMLMPGFPLFSDPQKESADDQFWRDYLGDLDELHSIDLPASGVAATAAEVPVVETEIDGKLAESLRRLRNAAGVTLEHVAQAGWALLRTHYTSSNEVMFGITQSCRLEREAAGDDAYAFMNVVPVRCSVSDRASVFELLWHVRDQLRRVREHATEPYSAIKRALGLDIDDDLFDSVLEFDLQDPVRALEAAFSDEAVGDFRHYAPAISSLMVQFYGDTKMSVRLKYRSDRYDEASARQLLKHYIRLLQAMADEPWSNARDLSYLDEDEISPCKWPGPQKYAVSGKASTLHGRFEDQVSRTPDAIAVACGDECLSYAELDAAATRLASRLQSMGARPDTLVGLCMERSLEQVVGILGILKSGAGYLPLDPDYPEERLAFQLQDSNVKIVVASDEVRGRLPAENLQFTSPVVDSEEVANETEAAATAESLAYVIYTSGSTGKPKGVQVTHHNVARLFDACQGWLHPGIGDVWTMFHSFAFDFSVWEIWGALLYGGRLEVVSKEIARSPEAFHELLQERGVTVLSQTPSAFSQLMKVDATSKRQLPALRAVIFGGEALDVAGLLPWIERHGDETPRLINMYGITETTVHVTFRQILRKDAAAMSTGSAGSPIGWPLPDLYVRLLDSGGRPVPPGVPGEICVGGAGVTRGYLNRPELNERHFVIDRYEEDPHARLYKSGDFARVMRDGELYYVGRRDDQVKVRGYRIDLGEISSTLRRLPQVEDGLVVVREPRKGDRRIVAYYVSSDDDLTESRIRELLADELPVHMLPSALIRLQEIPVNANNKVDYKALPSIAESGAALLTPEELPRTATEKVLAGIWSDVLDRPQVRRNDDFFALGGDSVIALQVVSKARAHGIEISPRDIFHHSSVADLARSARHASQDDDGDNEAEQESDCALAPIQRWLMDQFLANPDHWNQAYLFRMPAECDINALEKACLAVVRHHDALRFRFIDRGEQGWCGRNVEPDEAFEFSHVELDHLEPDERRDAVVLISREIEDSLSLSSGLLMRAAHFSGGLEDGDRLLLAIHQLAIDTVSWGILLEDLETAYWQVVEGREPALPVRTTSYRKWTEVLSRYASSAAVNSERAYWQKVMDVAPGDLWDAAGEKGIENDTCSHKVSLDIAETRALLGDVHDAYGTEMLELLLTGMTQACAEQWPDCPELRIDVQHHGRDHGFEQVDLSRTVGWFNTIHPVVLNLRKTDSLARNICEVKSHLRSMPYHGLGYGLLRYLRAAGMSLNGGDRAQASRILFSYLGRQEQLLGSRLFRKVNEDTGSWRGPDNRRTHDLEIVGQVQNDLLEFDFRYSPEVVPEDVVKRLSTNLVQALRELIQHCRTRDRAMRTPADFPLARLSQEELDAFPMSLDKTEDILPLTPLQRLHHALSGTDSDVGFDQWVFHLDGRIDEDLFEEAWRELFRRHDALRTVFVDHGLAEPHQVILRGIEFKLQKTDWRLLTDDEQQRRLDEFLAADRKQGFELSVAPLTRITLIRTGATQWALVWSHYQGQVDGWSWPVLARELGEIYDALCERRAPELDPPGSYRNYIEWLDNRDLDEYAAFWREHLGVGRRARSLISKTRRRGDAHRGPRQTMHKRIDLTEKLSRGIREFARKAKLTPSGVFQGAWALLLSGLTGRFDVTLGAAFSGRTAGIPVAENTVGSFVNDLPVRIHIEPTARVDHWIENLRGLQADLNHYQNVSPTEIHRWSGSAGAGRLFDSLLVFQNYATGDSARCWGKTIRVTDFSAGVRTNYPVTVGITPAETFVVDMFYDESLIDHIGVKTLARHLVTVLNTITQNPDVHVDTVLKHISQHAAGDFYSDSTDNARPGRMNRRKTDGQREVHEGNSAAQSAYVPHSKESVEGKVAAICREVLDIPDIRLEQNFFDIGAQSVSLIEIHARLQQEFEKTFPIVKLFQHPTVAAISRYLDEGDTSKGRWNASQRGAARRAAMMRRQQSHRTER